MRVSVGDRALLERGFPGRSGDRAQFLFSPDFRARMSEECVSESSVGDRDRLADCESRLSGFAQIEIASWLSRSSTLNRDRGNEDRGFESLSSPALAVFILRP